MQSLLKCRRFEIVRKETVRSDGRRGVVEIVVHPGAVVVLPLLSDDELIMLRNFRPALDRELWELPAGTLDVEGETPRAAALRELEEEAGFSAGSIAPLGEFYTSPGVMTELIRAFVATDLIETTQRLEATEQIVAERMSVTEALAMIRDGRIVDAKTIITLLRWTTERKEST